jgi:hypothetical protein
MADIKAHLHTLAVNGEQPIGFTPGEVIAAAHRARRRKRVGAISVAAGVAGVAGIAAVAALTIPTGSAVSPAGTNAKAMSLTALTHTAASTPADARTASSSAKVDGVTVSQVVALAEHAVGARLVSVQVSTLPPSGELDLAAAVATSGGPYVNIQVSPAHTLITVAPTCAELSDIASGDGDGYYGPCSIQRLPNGTLLIARSGHTTASHDSMAQAILIRPDGSGVFAEDTNTADVTAEEEVKLKTEGGKSPAIVAQAPPADSAALVNLVQTLASDQS